MAAARNTLKSAWRPLKVLDSVYTKTTLAQGRITKQNKKNPLVIVIGGGKWLSLLMNLKISFRRKYIRLRDMIIQEERKIQASSCKISFVDAILHPLAKHGNQCWWMPPFVNKSNINDDGGDENDGDDDDDDR
ncbi:hypothetical protein PoB_005265600 [Plakobranchus ocellatus]|uniref:Uncharacterized protein n=1 Tax=Plakobranchus ocellatus TaxID=259542 RepID=A0AAV4C048_9GAST|nr:hypothetical protein PoB_005265600 [Plakobranchus ocellatus]